MNREALKIVMGGLGLLVLVAVSLPLSAILTVLYVEWGNHLIEAWLVSL